MGVKLEFTIVDHEISDWEKMILTSNCKFNVMSTNLLSWWSSYFCEVEDKEVYYPSKWYNKNIDTKDLFPVEWNKIMVEEAFEDVKESVTIELTDDHSKEDPKKIDVITSIDKNLELTIEEN